MLDSELDATVFAPSIVYDRDDPWVTTMRRLALLPVLPISGEGESAYEPIWADDVARCVVADLSGGDGGSAALELAGPERLSYDQIARADRPRRRAATGRWSTSRSASFSSGSRACAGRSGTPRSPPGRRPS